MIALVQRERLARAVRRQADLSETSLNVQLADQMLALGRSPLSCTVILGLAAASAAEGMAGAIDDGLKLTEISDVERMTEIAQLLRGAADVFEAVYRRARQ